MSKHSLPRFSLGVALVLALLGGPRSQAAHLYAQVPAGINVYDVAANGSLAFRQFLPAPAFTAMAITPGGRFLYATDGWTLYTYAVQDNGTLAARTPLKFASGNSGSDGIRDLAVHATTGDYLYALTKYSLCLFRTADSDGHLTADRVFGGLVDARRMAVHPWGEYIVIVTAGLPDGASIWQTNLDGTIAGALATIGLPDGVLDQGEVTADPRWAYVLVPGRASAVWDSKPIDTDTNQFYLLLPELDKFGPKGSDWVIHGTENPALRSRLLAVGDRYLVLSRSGRSKYPDDPGSQFQVYRTFSSPVHNVDPVDAVPIEVYALGAGAGAWNRNLWVATNDGIVTYSLAPLDGPFVTTPRGIASAGRTARISKVMVNGATRLLFGLK